METQKGSVSRPCGSAERCGQRNRIVDHMKFGGFLFNKKRHAEEKVHEEDPLAYANMSIVSDLDATMNVATIRTGTRMPRYDH